MSQFTAVARACNHQHSRERGARIMSLDLEQLKHGKSEVPVEDLFLRRWSPRAFLETPVDTDTLKAIFSAGQWAPSSNNEQPWRFLLGRKGDSVWQRIFDSLAPRNQAWTKAAPVLYASFAKKTFSQNDAANPRVSARRRGCISTNLPGSNGLRFAYTRNGRIRPTEARTVVQCAERLRTYGLLGLRLPR